MAGVAVKEARRATAGACGVRSFVLESAGSAPLFVWKTNWDTPRDAQEFFRAYNDMLRQRVAHVEGAGAETERSWREGGAVTRLRLEGDSVSVARGPEADSAEALRLAHGR